MGFTEDLGAEIGKILAEKWTERDGAKVPDAPEVGLGNDAVKLNGAVLYADLADSTGLVMKYTPTFVAKVYKIYLAVACRIIRKQEGEITAFDGDRVMAVFLGKDKETRAVRSAFAIADAVDKLVNPKLRAAYKELPAEFAIRQAVGVDTSALYVARTGIRGSNDLVWVGRAANFAAKLCALREDKYATWVTDDVHRVLDAKLRMSSDQKPLWEARRWTAQNNHAIHRSAAQLPLP